MVVLGLNGLGWFWLRLQTWPGSSSAEEAMAPERYQKPTSMR